MNKQQLDWVKTTLTNDENASDAEMRAYLIDGGLTEVQADEWMTKRSFYSRTIVMQDDDGNDIGIYNTHTRAIDPLAA